MADYNIYIHAIGTGGGTSDNPTIPWSQRGENGNGGAFSQTESQTGSLQWGNNAAKSIIRAASFAQNPDSLISSAITAIGKAFPIAAAAYACVKLGEAIIDNVVQFGTIESGDYTNQTNWNNIKKGVQMMLHPISSAVEISKMQNQWARDNKKLQAQRDLLGDSVINSYTGRGI